MILLTGILAGLAAGVIRSWVTRRPYQAPPARWSLLVILAFIPQYLAFIQPAARAQVPDSWAPYLLVGSQALLLVWVLVNLRNGPYWLIGIGLLLNFLVIALNGGLMPIRPEMVQWLAPNAPAGAWQIGERLGNGKDIVLHLQDTRLWYFSDYLRLPEWVGYRLAFSVGDVLLAAGAFILLYKGKDLEEHHAYEKQRNETHSVLCS